MGKILIFIGIVLVVIGLMVQFADRIPFIGRLPGDIIIDRGNFKFYFPIATSILISLILSLVLYFIQWFRQ